MTVDKEVILRVRNLSQHFKLGRKNILKAVDNISFDVNRGETFSLVGESGSGKSTTGRSIIRLYDPTSGDVTFADRKISGKIDRQTERMLRTKNANDIPGSHGFP